MSDETCSNCGLPWGEDNFYRRDVGCCTQSLIARLRARVAELEQRLAQERAKALEEVARVIEDEGPYGDCETGCREMYAEAIRSKLAAQEAPAENPPCPCGKPGCYGREPEDGSCHKCGSVPVGTRFLCEECSAPAADAAPVPMQLCCPNCCTPHIDEGEWASRPHKTHQCQVCRFEWRPYGFATVGVAPCGAPVTMGERRG